MYPVSEAYLKSVGGRERSFPTRCKFAGLTEYVTQKHIRSGSYTDIIDSNNVISMGNACAKKVEFKIQDFTQPVVWKDHRFTMEKGLVVDGVTEWVPWGTFWVTDAVTSNNHRTISITAYDYMFKLSKVPYETELVAPFHYCDLLAEFLRKSGLTLSTKLEMPAATDADYTILSWPKEDFSFSDIAGHLAGMVGGNARISTADPAVIEFVWYTPTQTIIEDTLYQDGFERLADSALRVDYFVVGDNILIENTDDSNAGELDFDDDIDPATLPHLTFAYNNKTMTASVRLTSGYKDRTEPIEIPAKVKKDGSKYTVTSIKANGFEESSATAFELPDTITAIGDWAFSSCKATEINIPNSVATIGDAAFSFCEGLTSAVIPAGVTYVGDSAFMDCINLATVYWNAVSIEEIGSTTAFVFQGCSALENFIIAEGVTVLPAYMLTSCESIKSVNIPRSVTTISADAFRFCTGLTSITIPEAVTSIGSYAFTGCTNLETVYWNPVSIEEIGSMGYIGVFEDCPALENFIIADGVTRLPDMMLAYCTGIRSIVIPSSVTAIGSGAFSDCTNLRSITVNAATGSISGSPWGAPRATVTWAG